MGSRYMPDLTGVALALSSCALAGAHNTKKVLAAFFVAGLMLGVRLSYAPILLPPLWASLYARRDRMLFVGVGLAGVAGSVHSDIAHKERRSESSGTPEQRQAIVDIRICQDMSGST